MCCQDKKQKSATYQKEHNKMPKTYHTRYDYLGVAIIQKCSGISHVFFVCFCYFVKVLRKASENVLTIYFSNVCQKGAACSSYPNISDPELQCSIPTCGF